MKDLYTFDATKEQALQTYEKVREAYSTFFRRFKIPFLVAKADSGNIGGDLSHEYHVPSSSGEDTVFSCNSCTYTANEEVATKKLPKTACGKSITKKDYASKPIDLLQSSKALLANPPTSPGMDLSKVQTGDPCPDCEEGTLMSSKAIELGHTFHLGTKYSEPLRARIIGDTTSNVSSTGAITSSANSATIDPEATQSNTTAIEMGCHGIGVSRMIAALADVLADEKGLNWPRVVAPFDAVIIPAKGFEDDAVEVLDSFAAHGLGSTDSSDVLIDAILDDREKDLPWKLKDADLIGYPVIVVLGRAWKKEKKCEAQCRRLKLREEVAMKDLKRFVMSVLAQL